MNNIFTNTQVSLFTPTHIDGQYKPGISPQTVSLSDVLFRPLQPDLIDAIRSKTDKDKQKQLKHMLYAITPSAICQNGRSRNNIINHTGLMAFDIDNVTGDIDRYKDMIRQIPYVLYLGLSASGNGLWGLILIAYPENHAQHFDAMQDMFKKIGIEIDTAPRAINSLRYLSYDPDAYVNTNAVKFEGLLDVAKPIVITPVQDLVTCDTRSDLPSWFNQNCTAYDMHEILANSGFTYHSRKGNHHYFTRPNKSVHAGLSLDYDEGRKTLFSFSSSVPLLEQWKQEPNGWSCSPVTALMLYGCGGFDNGHWKMAYDYIRSRQRRHSPM